MRTGAVLTRERRGSPQCVGDGGGAVDLMVELFSCYHSLHSHAPLDSVSLGGGRWELLTNHWAESALRQVVSLAGSQPAEYALHSLQIGGATHLAAGGTSAAVLRKEGRWAGENGFRPYYVRSQGGDAV